MPRRRRCGLRPGDRRTRRSGAPISCGGDSPRAGSASAGPVRGLSPRRLSLVYLVAKLWEQGRRRTADVTETHPTGHELQIRAWLTPFPPRGGRTFPDPESRPRNSLKSPHNSREWLPGRRGVAAVRLRRRPGSGSRPELFWPWPAKGAASAPLKPPRASASRHGVWLNQPPPLLERPSR